MKININLDQDSPMEDISLAEAETPTILLRNIEEIARASHKRYNEIEKKKNNKVTPIKNWMPRKNYLVSDK